MQGDSFCGKCGATVTDPADAFCRKCGASLLADPMLDRDPTSTIKRTEQPPVQQTQPKKDSMGILLGVIGLVTIVFVGLNLMGTWGSQSAKETLQPSPPPYQFKPIQVSAGSYYTLTFPNLKKGNVLEGYFTIQGGNNDVGFRVQGPSGADQVSIARVANRHDFRLDVAQDGPYVLIFNNGFSVVTDKMVALNYRGY